MKRFSFLFILTLISSSFLGVKTTLATESVKQITNHLGKKVTVMGENSAVARWNVVTGAKFYNVYYKVCGETTNVGAVRVPDKGGSVEIKYLDPTKNYCYRVGAMVGNKEAFGTEQPLTSVVVSSKPVLGVVSQKITPPTLAYQNMNNVPVSSINGNCTNTGKVTINWEQPAKGTVGKQHILYGEVGSPFQYAVRNMPSQAKQITINSLNTCKTYNFQPIVIELSGKAHNLNVQTLTPVN